MEINGLPLHPLSVHAVVVLVPLTALVGLVYALVPKWRWLLRWPLVAVAVLGAAFSVLATSAGEALAESRPGLEELVEEHAEYGELLRNLALAYVAASALGAWALGGTSALVSGRGTQETRGALGWVAIAALVAGGVALLVAAFLAGESGARAVWGA